METFASAKEESWKKKSTKKVEDGGYGGPDNAQTLPRYVAIRL
jgi:hypothetical protein